MNPSATKYCGISPLRSPSPPPPEASLTPCAAIPAPPPEALQSRCAARLAPPPREGNEPYSIDEFISCLSSTIPPDRIEEQKQALAPLPIVLKDTLLKPDRQICSILDASETLTRAPSLLKPPSIPQGKPLNCKGDVCVHGKLLLRLAGEDFDGSCFNGYVYLPHKVSFIDRFIDDGAHFILLVPSNYIVTQLYNMRFTRRIPCAVISAEGPPEYLIKMAKEMDRPVLAMLSTDSMSLRMLAYYGRRLKNFKWLGIRPSETPTLTKPLPSSPDIDDPDWDFTALQPLQPRALTQQDIKAVTVLSKDDYIRSRPEWAEEFRVLRDMKYKIGVERLTAVGALCYLTEWYLPMKLQTQDWI